MSSSLSSFLQQFFSVSGLWSLDLAISQLLLERVEQQQRGVVNGVQSSLNMILDMVKFVLVIALPLPRHFGLLVILSFGSVCIGAVSYSIYSYRMRGHLFHFDRLCRCSHKENGTTLHHNLSVESAENSYKVNNDSANNNS